MTRLNEIFHTVGGRRLWDRVANPLTSEKSRFPYIPIRPDQLLVIRGDEDVKNFFLEVEIAPKKSARFRRRVRGFRAYYQSDGFLKRYGQGDDRRKYPFTVLITAPTEERRNNLIELALREGSLWRCWFAVYDEVIAQPLGKVWLRGEAYKAALSQLSSAELAQMYKTHRRTERDRFVKAQVEKRSLTEA